jgi:probable HAF family extracellular repeat protein
MTMRALHPFRPVAVAAACLLGGAAGAAQPITYHVTPLGPPGATQPLVGGINALGHVAGAAILPGKLGEHALLLSTARFIDLGTLGGRTSFATAVSDGNAVVGTSATATNAQHAFLWQAGTMTDLGSLPGGDLSEAEAINKSRQVVGFASVGSAYHAFRYAAGAMVDLGTLPGASASAARGINDDGVIVGDSGTSATTHAFVYRDGRMEDLGTLGGPGASSAALAVNGAGQVAGAAWDPATGGATTAVRWTQGVATDLGLPPGAGATSSYARGINDRGLVVGTFARPQAPVPQGAFISDGTRIANLEDLLDATSAAWAIYAATGIDQSNQISAIVWDGAAYQMAVLVPVAPASGTP